ncbi:hypothetical protein QAD02_023918 [Eretmocerus hayati]|uniref:Uncharacterized protein n=1 Tax=Eretmocerus hayati TaxID=131215 RepID=A0ACC2PYT5_9HYME|nr:hypothetical protein QAD02_023918 [Eretmocerus hayati]
MLSLLLEYSNGIFDLEHRDREGQSPLCAAAWIEFPECVEILLRLGANIEHTDSEGRTPLELVSIDGRYNQLDRCEKCIQLLVEAGAKIRDILIKLLPDDTVDHIASIHEDYFKMNYPNNMASFAGLDQHDRHRQLKFCYEKAKFIVKYRVLYESQNLSIEEPMVDENMGKSMKLRSYYEACLAEIVLLQNSSITSSITHHDILTANKYFHKRVRDEKVYESFDEINIWNRFRLYAEDLYDRFKCLNKLHKTWEKSVTNLSLLLGLDSNTYYSIIHNILNHLDENDLVSMTRL